MAKSESKKLIILRALIAGKVINPADAVKLCNCWRLGDVIHVLTKHEGWHIDNLNPLPKFAAYKMPLTARNCRKIAKLRGQGLI